MPLKQFELGELQLRYRTSTTTLRVTCSCVLELPASVKQEIDLHEVAHLTTNGELWTAKATVCRMDVTASFSSTLDSTLPDIGSLASAISESPVWMETGITLRPEQPESPQDGTTRMSFIVNHPDLYSESLAPTGVARAKFATVSFGFALGEKTIKQKKRRKYEPPACRRTPNSETADEMKSRYLLRTRTRKVPYAELSKNTEDYGTSSDDLVPSRDRTVGRRVKVHPRRDGTREPYPSSEDLTLLVRAALHKFLGCKRTGNGVVLQQDIDGPSLVDIAPAVWNMRYLQAFANRAEHMSRIASCVSGLTAESPSLRKMINSLSNISASGKGKEEIHARLHKLVHRGLATSRDATMTLTATVAKSAGESLPGLGAGPTGNVEAQHNASSSSIHTSDAHGGLLREDSMMHEHQLEVQGLLEDDPDVAKPQANIFDEAVLFDQDVNAEFLLEDDFNTESSSYLESPESMDYHYVQGESMEPEREISTLDNHEWLDLSQASLVLDENGHCIPFDELDEGDYSYQIVPL